MRVGLDELLAGHRALAAVDASSRMESFFALRVAMCSRVEDLPVFADAFHAVFGSGWHDALDLIPPAARAMLPRIGDPGARPAPGAEIDGDEARPRGVVPGRAAAHEGLRRAQ